MEPDARGRWAVQEHVYNITVPATCLPHTGFAGVWTPATHAELICHRTITRVPVTAALCPAAERKAHQQACRQGAVLFDHMKAFEGTCLCVHELN